MYSFFDYQKVARALVLQWSFIFNA